MDDTERGSAADGPQGLSKHRGGQDSRRRQPAQADRGESADPETPPRDEGRLLSVDELAPRRGLRRVAGGVVLVEGVGLVAAAAVVVVELFRETPTETGGAIAQAVVALVLGLGLVQLARVTFRADERARVPVLVWQVLQVSIGAPAMSSSRVLAVVLLTAAAVAGVGVLVPGVLRPDVRGLARN
jgi:hypothetical protein